MTLLVREKLLTSHSFPAAYFADQGSKSCCGVGLILSKSKARVFADGDAAVFFAFGGACAY